MYRLICLISVWLAGYCVASATSIGFSDVFASLQDRTNQPLTSAEVEIGGFADGFEPTEFNRAQWTSHWLSTGVGYYAESDTREWSAELIIGDNGKLREGSPLYVWVRKGEECGLYSDPSWMMPAVSALGLAQTFRFSPHATAIFGAFDSDSLTATTAAADVTITVQPVSQIVATGAEVTLSVMATGTSPLSYQWRKDGAEIPGATEASFSIFHFTAAAAGRYTVDISSSLDTVTSAVAELELQEAPVITAPPSASNVIVGQRLALTVAYTGSPTPAFQWYKDGMAITGATNDTYTVVAVTANDAGDYTVRLTNTAGSVTSEAAVVTVTPQNYLSNLSVRASMDAQQTLIVGFVIAGGSKPILVRAAGPALKAAFDLDGYVTDPRLDLYNADGAALVSNDDWDATLASTFSTLGAFPFTTGSKDAAIFDTSTNANTVHAPTGGVGGIQLIEVYDADPNHGVKLVNVSARNHCGAGNNVLIAGFVIAGSGKKHVLIRGVGPGLTYKFGLTGVLADPKLTLFDASGHAVASNDDWSSSLAATFGMLGAFDLQLGSKDAALLIELDAGVYTAQISGADNGTGEALVEIYDASP